MKNQMYRDMMEASRLTRTGHLLDATELLQRVLGAGSHAHTTVLKDAHPAENSMKQTPRIVDMRPADAEEDVAGPSLRSFYNFYRTPRRSRPVSGMERAASAHLPQALSSFIERIQCGSEAKRSGVIQPSWTRAPVVLPNGAQFLDGSYSMASGSRDYKLYVPSGYCGQPLPLVVMLHGCTQSPDDFAAGTRMNELAEEHICFVAYPAQSTSANCSKCWNWFSPSDQQRGRGEPALIAGITRQVMRDFSVDHHRVYVAGLSAGGAAAAIMGMTYPDLYAAVGVHSGLACRAASDLPSAFSAMRQGSLFSAGSAGNTSDAERNTRVVPTIVFHGDQDTTVHPCNGDQVIAQWKELASGDLRTVVLHDEVSGGLAYSRTLHVDGSGQAILEQWVVRGAGHAWSGGSPAGSYTDPRGPDASREILRFFLEHRHFSSRRL